MSINEKLFPPNTQNPGNPYGFTKLQRLALFLCKTAFAMACFGFVVIVIKAVFKLSR